MNDYSNTERGTFQRPELASQLCSFEGLVFKGRNGHDNVTPTDIDGLVQLDRENCFIVFELKHSGGMSGGQSDAYTRLCDIIQKGGTECIFILAEHNTPFPETIIAKDAIVKKIYMKGKWYEEKKRRTLKEIADRYVEHLRKGK